MAEGGGRARALQGAPWSARIFPLSLLGFPPPPRAGSTHTSHTRGTPPPRKNNTQPPFGPLPPPMAPRRNRTALGGVALAALAAGAGAASSAASVVVALSGPGRDGPALQAALPRCLGVGAGAYVQLAADGCVFSGGFVGREWGGGLPVGREEWGHRACVFFVIPRWQLTAPRSLLHERPCHRARRLGAPQAGPARCMFRPVPGRSNGCGGPGAGRAWRPAASAPLSPM